MRPLLRIRRHIAVQQLPVAGVAIDVVSLTGAWFVHGRSSLTASTRALDRPHNFLFAGGTEERFHLFQTIFRYVLRHGQKLRKITPLIRDTALIRHSASRAK